MDDESYFEVDELGTKYWKNKKGLLHRINGPAMEYSSGSKHWYKDGKRHRLNGPAVEYIGGHKEWYQNGLRHRLDGPSYIHSSGTKYWYKNGALFKNKESFFDTLTEEEKEIALFSEDFFDV